MGTLNLSEKSRRRLERSRLIVSYHIFFSASGSNPLRALAMRTCRPARKQAQATTCNFVQTLLLVQGSVRPTRCFEPRVASMLP
jgi:hypothetical protein